jgi:sRNA-binding regulator protein Hfq
MKKLKVNRSIYSDSEIKQTMMVYKNHAIMTVSFKDEYAVITFCKCKYDEVLTVKEFENYMIGVENS